MTAVLNLDSSGFTSGIEDAEDGMGSLKTERQAPSSPCNELAAR